MIVILQIYMGMKMGVCSILVNMQMAVPMYMLMGMDQIAMGMCMAMNMFMLMVVL